ncbi:lipopolysaccharide assembly protein LapA domain-containing protein [Aliikangiella sp. IMCC44359]|uniref:lipopolysaccharide assembly protein LapA domain-containing protein n=1 Tax=Aliikangiella sp. IMCC44359 TaxID=3459125 RepID=UPI00403ACAF3
MRNFLTILLAVIIVIISALFFSQNDSLVKINYFIGQIEWQLDRVMMMSLLVGVVVGILSVIGSLFKAKFQLRQAKSKILKQEKELNSLRALPVKDEY